LSKKFVIYFILSISFSVTVIWPAAHNMASMLNYNYLLEQHHVAPWGVLVLCLGCLILKRHTIKKTMHQPPHPLFYLPGAALALLAMLIPGTPDFLVLKAAVIWTALFMVMYGRAAAIPTLLLATYSFTILFPMAVEKFADVRYAMAAVIPAVHLADLLGLPVSNAGQVLSFPDPAGGTISVMVAGACAGPATMAVFIAIFTMMMLDVKLSPPRAWRLLLFGMAGTWFQNIVRIIIIAAAGHLWGKEALRTAHFWTIYALFPLWYLIFTAIYFRAARQDSLTWN